MSDRDTDYIGRVWYKIWMKEKTVIDTSIAQYLKYIKLTACTLSVTETKHCTKKFGKGSAVALHELDTFLSVQVHSILPFSVSLDGGWCSEHLRYWHRLFGIYMSDTCCLPVWAVTVEYHQYLGENPLRKQAVDSHLNTKGRNSHGKKKAKALFQPTKWETRYLHWPHIVLYVGFEYESSWYHFIFTTILQ